MTLHLKNTFTVKGQEYCPGLHIKVSSFPWLSERIVCLIVLLSKNLPSLIIITVIEFNQNVICGHSKSILPPTNTLLLFYPKVKTKCYIVLLQNYGDDSSHAIIEASVFSFYYDIKKISECNYFFFTFQLKPLHSTLII